MSDRPPAIAPDQAIARSVPPISRLSDFDILLGVLRAHAPTLDHLRIAIGMHVESLSNRGEARRTRDWRRPLAYRDTVVACVRELIRWGFVEPITLGDDASSYERTRDTMVQLTEAGKSVAAMKAPDRRELIGRRLLDTYLLFQAFLRMLERHDAHLPELPDSLVKTCFPDVSHAADDETGTKRVAQGCAPFLSWSTVDSVRRGPMPTQEEIARGVAAYLRRRYAKRPPKDVRDLTGAVNKALSAVFLDKLGFTSERNAFDRCLRWARDLYLANDGRHVHNVPGWLTWAAAEVRQEGTSWQFDRRGVSRYRQEVKAALFDAYRRLAQARRSASLEVPLIPIYEVRETAAFQCRVCDEVVDRVLGDLAFHRDSIEGVVVQLQIASAREFVPSARPFIYEKKRFYYVTMQEIR